jgi:transposase
MSLASADLPTDPESLRALAAALRAELGEKDLALAARDAELRAKTLHIEKLRAELAALRRARFGRSSERLDRAIGQLELLVGDLEEGEAEGETRAAAAAGRAGFPAPRRPDRRPSGRKPLPEHLPRETVLHEPPRSCPACGGTTLGKVGEDEREVLEYVPSYFKVVRHLRPKLSCRACETIVQAPMPSLPIERGRPGPGLLAHVLVAKYWTTSPCTGRA